MARASLCAAAALLTIVLPGASHAQHGGSSERMWMWSAGGGWTVMGMAQAFPIMSTSPGAEGGSAADELGLYLTQPAVMLNVASPGGRAVLHTTLNFEGLTQEEGEQTFGGWGEGFLDRRHPHTLVHELMLSVNFPRTAGGAFSISGGKGFAPYGTDDPMSRPGVKYPTNHHLSQILERWTVNGVYVRGGWSLEAGLFGGSEPAGPYDFSNIDSFGDSWSARLTRRFMSIGVETSASYGRVRETHDGDAVITHLYNGAVRFERERPWGSVYGLLEASLSDPAEIDGYYSILVEGQLERGPHRPYLRVEHATRPEFAREGAAGTDDFFRYAHDAHAIGSTRWLITSAGYGFDATSGAVSVRPFVEVQHHRVSAGRGDVEPDELFGRNTIWGLSAGFRVFFGGGPMRMGSYGVLDPMRKHGNGTVAPHTDASHAEHD